MIVHRLFRSRLGFACVAASFALLVSLLAATGRAANAAPSAQLLPADTVGYLTVHDVPAFKAAWAETQFGRLLADPAMQPFLEDIQRELSALVAGLQEEIGLTASELYALPRGQLTLALVPSGPSAIAVVGIVDLGDNQGDAERLLARGAETLEQHGAKRQEEDFQGVGLVIYELPAGGEADGQAAVGAAPAKIAYGITQQTLVLASDVDVLKGIVARFGGDAADTFATHPVFSRIAEQTASDGRTPPLQWFLDPVAIFSHMLGAGGNQQAQMAAGMLPLLGLDKLKGFGGSMDLVTGPYDSVTRIQVSTEEPRQGLLKLLTFPQGNLQPESWVPNDVSTYFSMNWDVDTAWQAISELYDQMQGPGAFEQTLRMFTDAPNGPGIDVKKDIVDPVGGRITMVTDYAEPITPGSQRVLVGVSLDDTQTLSAALDKLMQRAGGNVQKREFQGHVIYDVKTPVAPGEQADENAPVVQMAVAIAHDYFFFASNVTLLEKVLRIGEGIQPLAQSLDYRLVVSHIPETASGVSFSRPEQAWRSLYEMIRSGEMRNSVAGMAMFFPSLLNLSQAIDGEKLPEFDVVRRYLAPSGGYLQSDANGVLLVNFALRKESP